MKLTKIFPIVAMLCIVLISGCQKDDFTDPNFSSETPVLKKGKPVKPPVEGNLEAVDLGMAGNFVILSKSGITDVYPSAVTGDVGSSPITGAAILLECDEVTGTIYSVDAAGPLPCRVTNASRLATAVKNMQTAYTDAAGRSNPKFLNEGAGDLSGLTLTPGLHKWTSDVQIPTEITFEGSSTDVFILQVAGTLDMSANTNIILKGGVLAENIFWQVAGAVTIGVGSHFEGNILGMTGINMLTGASINGRLLAQTEVTLQQNTVTIPNVQTDTGKKPKKH